MNTPVRHLLLAFVAGLALPTVAAAQALPPDIPPPPAATVEVAKDPSRCSSEVPGACLDGVGGGVTSLDGLRAGNTTRTRGTGENEERAQQQARAVAPGQVGMAASTGSVGAWTVWGSGSASWYEGKVTIAPYETDSYNILLGADRTFGERLVLGFTLGYENTDTTTRYNGGNQDRDGLQVGLYGAWLVNDVVSVDAAVGYAALDTDENRVDPGTSIRVGTVATPGATLLGSYDANRAFATVNVNAVKVFGKWVLGGRLGAFHTVESQDAYSETGGAGARTIRKRHLDLTQAYASVDLGYSAGEFEPYALVGYRNDLGSDDGNSAGGLPAGIRTQPTDDDDWQTGIGVRYFGRNGITGSVEWLKTFGREKFDEDSLTLTLRVPF